MSPDLSASDLALLEECARISTENSDFYDHVYSKIKPDSDKAILGRVMAQKTAFTSAVEAIIEAHDIKAGHIGTAELNNIGIPKATSDPNNRDIQLFWSMIYDHEARFQRAVSASLRKLTDATTRSVLEDHLSAASLALEAMKEAEIKAVW